MIYFPIQGGLKLGCRAQGKRFYMIFHFKAAQNLIAEHYERDFDMIFHFKAASFHFKLKT